MKSKILRILASGVLLLSLLLSLFPSTAFAAKVSDLQEQTTDVSVPAISSPFTSHPVVFIVEDTYQIAFATNANGLAWVEIGGVKYNDSQNGLMNWKSKYHKVTVPQAALDAAGTYKICFRSLSARPTISPTPGSTVSRTYPFDPIPADRAPVFYCSSDQHNDKDPTLNISKYKAFDVYVLGGDYSGKLTEDTYVKLLLDMAGAVTQGRKPTIYTRGNHEIRGAQSHNLYRVSGYSESTGAYYTVKMPGIFGIVLDAGEDKVDSHSEYGGTVQFSTYRNEQTQWLREIVTSREWEQYPIRMVFCHVPFSFYAADTFESVYKEWTELLDQMGVSIQISGHTHKYGIYGPDATRHKADPNFTTLIVSDRENGDYTYSSTFVTANPTGYKIENILSDLTVKVTKTIPVFTNAYVNENAGNAFPLSLEDDTAVTPTPATRASVPSISSPYTLHPTVFAVEDGYQIVFSTDTTGMAWATVGGKKYYDQTTGLMDWETKYHSIRVPRVDLDSARSYSVSFQSMTTRAAYSPTHGSTVSRTYPFTPMADKKEPVILCLSDFRGLATEARAVATYKPFDALYIGGDYTYNGNAEANVRALLDNASAITSGTKPVIFTRGNREIRGNYAYLLDSIAPTSAEGKSYYTIEQPDFFAIVLDSGEDKLDSNSEYGGTTDYQNLRKEQTAWLKEVLAEGKWKDYPTRIAFCHIPMTRITTAGIKEDYAEWTNTLNQMGISLLFSGHKYNHALYAANDSGNVTAPNFPTLSVCDVDNADYTYSGSFVTLGTTTIKIENVSAAKKLLKTTTTSNVTAPNYKTQSDTYLMFDFNNDSVAQERYHSFVYGGMNFDQKAYWDHETNTTASTISRGVLSFSPVDETITSVGVYSRALNNAKGQWAYRPLHYFTKSTDYCQVRFKIDNAVASTSDGTAKFRLDVDCPNDLNDAADVTKTYTRFEQSFKAADVVGKGYVTLTFPLNSTEYNKFQFMNLVHPQFVNLKSASGATAVFSIDYIYIGPQESFPKQDDTLFFDFTDTEADRQRYNSFTYNYLNFDDPSNWTAYNASPMSTIADGALKLAVPTGNTDTSHSTRSRRDNVSALHFVPGKDDILQVRIQVKNAVATTDNGIVTFRMNLDRPNAIVNSAGTSRTWTNIPIDFTLADHVDQGWFVLETRLTDAEYLASDWVNLVHPQFLNMTNASGKTAEFLIDYIYIGPESKSPTAHTVTFCAEDGTVLEQHKVGTGSTVAYAGTTPAKSYDENNHYSFAGWLDAEGQPAVLHSIAESITVYASFTAEAHSFEEAILTTPTCSLEGVKELSCTCGYRYTQAITPTDHSPSTIAAIAPTCTEPGMSEGSFCSLCNAVITAPVEIPALGHQAEPIPGYAPDCLSSGLSEGAKCSRCYIVLTEQIVLPRLGHDWVYTNLGEDHLAHCSRCNKDTTEAHIFAEGQCICGQVEIKEPIENTALKINHTLNLASDISVSLAVSKSLLEGFDMDTVYVLTELDIYQGNEKIGTETIKLLPVDQGYYYYFTLDGLTAVQMNDRFRSVLYGTKDGQTYCSPTDDYSIADYAYSQLSKNSIAESLRVLCAELLRYGAKAQAFKSYRTDSPVDAGMTEGHRAYLSDLDAVTFGNTNTVLDDLANAPITWAGKVLNLESKVALKLVFNPANYDGEVADLTLRISYQDIHGNTKTYEARTPELYNQAMGVYAFTLDTLLAAELRTVVSAQIYGGNTPVSPTLQYSPDTYGNNKTGELGMLCRALMAYSDAARAYFAP